MSSDGMSSSISDNDSIQETYVIHHVLINRLENLEDSLQLLLDSYLEAPYTFNEDGFLPIHLACIYYPANVNVVDIIMRANINGIVEPSKTPVARSNTSHLNAHKYVGTYPLHMAVINGACLDVVRLLTFQNPRILMKRDKNGKTPLSIAIKYKAKTEVFNFLLAENDTLSTIPDNRNNTPLHIACMHGCNKDVAETLLLSFPEALIVKNRDGLKPLDLAMRSSHCSDEIVNLLQDVSYVSVENLSYIDISKQKLR